MSTFRIYSVYVYQIFLTFFIIFFFFTCAAHEAVRRYKTLCERFRRETIKQQQLPSYTSTWNLFDKFALLKDAQASDWKSRNARSQPRIKSEPRDEAIIDDCPMLPSQSIFDMDFMNDNNDMTHSPNSITFDTSTTTNQTNERRNGSGLFVEPAYVGGSTDLSTDTIAAFCQFLEANLKQFREEQSDELIEDITLLLFRKRKEYKRINRMENNTTPDDTEQHSNDNNTTNNSSFS